MSALQSALAWTYYLVFIAFSLSFGYIARLRPFTLLVRSFLLLMGLMALWAFSMTISTVAPTMQMALFWRKISAFGWGTVYSVVLHVCLEFSGSTLHKKRPWLLGLIYAPALINLVVFALPGAYSDQNYHLVMTVWGWSSLWVDTFWNHFHTVYYLLFAAAILLLVYNWAKKARQPHERKHASLIGISFVAAAALSIGTDTVLGRLTGGYSPQLTVVFLAFPAGAILLAIKRFNFIPIKQEEAPTGASTILNEHQRAMVYRNNGLFIYAMGFVNLAYRVLIARELTGELFWGGAIVVSGLILLGGFLVMNAQLWGINTRAQEFVLTSLVAVMITVSVFSYARTGALTVWTIIFPFFVTSVLYNNISVMLVATLLQVLLQVYMYITIGPQPTMVNSIDYLLRIISMAYAAYNMVMVNQIYKDRLRQNEEDLRFQTSTREVAWTLRVDTQASLEETMAKVLSVAARFLSANCVWYLQVVDGQIVSGIRECEFGKMPPGDNSASFRVYEKLPGAQGILSTGDMLTITRDDVLENQELLPYFQERNLEKITLVPIETQGRRRHYLLTEGKKSKGAATHHFDAFMRILADSSAAYIRQINARDELVHQAYHDPVTGMRNRLGFIREVNARLQAAPQGQSHGMLFLIVHALSEVNDLAGHELGDWAVRVTAQMLGEQVLPGELSGIHRSQAFLLFLPNQSEESILERAGQLRNALERTVPFRKWEFSLQPTIGIAQYPRDGQSAEELLNNAHFAANYASQSENQILPFAPAQKEQAEDTVYIRNSLRYAIESNELLLHYQPQISLENGEMVGVEALLRWNHNRIGPISPAVFIPLAEESGMVAELGNWALLEACRQGEAWHQAGLPRIRIGVNVSFRQLERENLLTIVSQALSATGFDPRYLELEITESATGDYSSEMLQQLRAIKALGVSIAIDDYGSDYSGLRRLNTLTVDRIKIDKGLIDSVRSNTGKGYAIVANIARLAKDLRISMLAEGVETQSQLDALKEMGCDEVQGYYYYKPLTVEEVAGLLGKKAEK